MFRSWLYLLGIKSKEDQVTELVTDEECDTAFKKLLKEHKKTLDALDRNDRCEAYTPDTNFLMQGEVLDDKDFESLEALIEESPNKAQCPTCKQILVSKHRHDFVGCECWARSNELISEFNRDYPELRGTEAESQFISTLRGIAIDGGPEYNRRLWYGNELPIELGEH